MCVRILALVVVAFFSMPISADPLDDAFTAFIKRDFATAERLVRPLAQEGNAFAQYLLGAMYYNGQGLPQDYAEGVKWYRKAADQGHEGAQLDLGVAYHNGKGVPQDYTEAVKWIRKAADQGHATAEYNLGIAYFNGNGVRKHYAESARWFRRAADQGHEEAQFNLGLAYDNGDGMPQDYAEAARWYRKAADKGNASAQVNLGVMYQYGSGVLKNFVLAHMWYNLASASQEARGETKELGRRNRDRIEQIMTSQQMAQAQALADEWQSKSHVPKGKVTWDDDKQPGFHPLKVASTGTGFFVSQQGHVLTNHHVIESCQRVRLRVAGQSSRDGTLVGRDSNNDLALLESGSRPDAVAPLSSRKRPQLGQVAIIFGFPLTGVLSSSGNLVTGTVSALSGLQDDSRLFQISAPVQPGNSGGPVMDASGAVIGVVVGKLDARAVEKAIADIPQNVNFAVKGALAVGFLDSNGVDYVTDSGDQPISVEEIAKRATRFTVLVECLK